MNISKINNNISFNLLEMKDWKTHFTNGTKGMSKTDPRILNYVENILKKSFDTDEKVNNNPIAPWIVKVVVEIGPENINTEKLNRIKSVVEYVKKTGNVANIPKMDLNQGSDFAKEKLDKMAEKEKHKVEQPKENPEGGEDDEEQKKELTPLQKAIYFQRKGKKIAPEIPDELNGNVERVWTSTDGSGRFWVKVLNDKWMAKACHAGRSWGIQCQSTTFANGNYINYQLLGPPKGQLSPITTLIGMGILKTKMSIGEVKQVGNVQPGSQEFVGYRDLDVQLIEFLSFAPEAKNIKYFGDYYGKITLDPYDSLHGGGIGFLYHLSQEKPDLFKKLAQHRPDLIEANLEIIESIFPNMEDIMNFNIQEFAQKDPEGFLMNLSRYIERYGQEAKDILNKIDLDSYVKKNPNLVEIILPDLTGVITTEKLNSIVNKLDLSNYIYNNKNGFFEWFKKVSITNNRELIKNIITKYSNVILSANLGGAKGAIDFLREMEKPKLPQHARAQKDLETGKYFSEREVNLKDGNGNDIRDENGQIKKKIDRFEIPDNLLIMTQKERRDFINQNKEAIKNSIKSDEKGKEITFLRLLFSQSNSQELEKTMKSEKDEFVKYYNDKFRLGEKKRVTTEKGETIESKYMPGEFELFSITNPQNIVRSDDGKIYYPIGADRTKKEAVNIIKYYHDLNTIRIVEKLKERYKNKLTKEVLNEEIKNNESKLKYISLTDYMKTILFSNENEETAYDYYIENFNPEKLNLTNKIAGYSEFFESIRKLFSKGLFYQTLLKFKDKLKSLGNSGDMIYRKFMQLFEIKKFLVKPGDMVKCMVDDDMTFYMGDTRRKSRPKPWNANLEKDVIDNEPVFLTYQRYYKVIDVGEYAGSINGKILIKDEGYYESGLANDGKTFAPINHEPPKERWFNSNLFDIKSTTVQDTEINENEKKLRNLIKNRIKVVSESKKKTTISYTGIVLDNKSQNKLHEWIKQMVKSKKLPSMEGWINSADHITINTGKANDKDLIGQKVVVKVIKYAFDEKIAAVSIVVIVNGEEIEFSKEKPHITLAYNENQGAKPVMSNNLTNWKFVPQSFVLSGIIKEVEV